MVLAFKSFLKNRISGNVLVAYLPADVVVTAIELMICVTNAME